MSTLEIIAECAQGFEGNPYLAKMLAHGAVKANADWIKYQLVYADELCVPEYPYYSLFKNLEMHDSVWLEITDFIKSNNCKVIFDIYGEASLRKAKKFHADAVKISTTDFYNKELFQKACKLFETIFVSIGGIPLEDIKSMYYKIPATNTVIFLYGYQSEPTPVEGNNLYRINSLMQEFEGISFGFMDHSKGDTKLAFDLSKVALGCGIKFIEKHITIAHALELEDHISALNIDEFKFFVHDIRTLSAGLGTRDLAPTSAEATYSATASKVVVARKALNKGTEISNDNVMLKRVTTIPDSSHFKTITHVVGRHLLVSKEPNQPICSDDIT